MGLLELLIIIILIMWLGGNGLHLGGDFIHLLLIVIVVLVIIKFLRKGGDI